VSRGQRDRSLRPYSLISRPLIIPYITRKITLRKVDYLEFGGEKFHDTSIVKVTGTDHFVDVTDGRIV
jgi:hypothetical protein